MFQEGVDDLSKWSMNDIKNVVRSFKLSMDEEKKKERESLEKGRSSILEGENDEDEEEEDEKYN